VIAALVTDRSLWYLARGTGVVCLVILTASVALGVAARNGGGASRVPRFAIGILHRNLSLLVLAFLAVHIATSVLDPFAAIGWTDAVVPLRAAYRPVWLGLGAVAFDLLLAIAITSILRVRLGLRTWRAVHWLAYACWPVAVVHGLGTGSDARSSWLLWLVGGSVATVVAVGWWRLASTAALGAPWRVAGASVIALAALLLAGWVEVGPLRAGWASRAGTPTPLLHPARPATTGVGR
jgi:methionine sulfoxide reductase heme-binding subunit